MAEPERQRTVQVMEQTTATPSGWSAQKPCRVPSTARPVRRIGAKRRRQAVGTAALLLLTFGAGCSHSTDTRLTFQPPRPDRELDALVAAHAWTGAAAIAAQLNATLPRNDGSQTSVRDIVATQIPALTDSGLHVVLRQQPVSVMVSSDAHTALDSYCVEVIAERWNVSDCAGTPVYDPRTGTAATTAIGSARRLVAAVNILAGRTGTDPDATTVATAVAVLDGDTRDGFGPGVAVIGPEADGTMRFRAPDGEACVTFAGDNLEVTDCPTPDGGGDG